MESVQNVQQEGGGGGETKKNCRLRGMARIAVVGLCRQLHQALVQYLDVNELKENSSSSVFEMHGQSKFLDFSNIALTAKSK